MFTPSRMFLRFAIGLAAVVTLLVACDSLTGPRPPDRSPFLTATLAGVDLERFPDGSGHLETPNLWLGRPAGCGVRVSFHHDPTILFRDPRGHHFPISRSELEMGLTVELWKHPGELVESICPGYIAPSHIVVSGPR